jgi:hypothetical protein
MPKIRPGDQASGNNPPHFLGMDMAEQLAKVAAAIAATAVRDSDWCDSIMIAPGFFEREPIETFEVIGGIRRKTVLGELVRIDFNLHNSPSTANVLRLLVRSVMTPLTERFGGVVQDTPEGLIILDGNLGKVDDCHGDPSPILERRLDHRIHVCDENRASDSMLASAAKPRE